jgi:hypothetical protein
MLSYRKFYAVHMGLARYAVALATHSVGTEGVIRGMHAISIYPQPARNEYGR